MKQGTPTHPKTTALMQSLKIPRAHASGILEMLWHYTGEYAREGNIGRFSDRQIAAAVEWEASPRRLINALVECRWLDRDDTHRLLVHDWFEHCGDHVHMQLARAGRKFANGLVPKLGRLKQEERESAEKAFGLRTPNQQRANGNGDSCAHNERTGNTPSNAHDCVTLPSPTHTQPKPSPTQPSPATAGVGGNGKLAGQGGSGREGGNLAHHLATAINPSEGEKEFERFAKVQEFVNAWIDDPQAREQIARRRDIDRSYCDQVLAAVQRDHALPHNDKRHVNSVGGAIRHRLLQPRRRS